MGGAVRSLAKLSDSCAGDRPLGSTFSTRTRPDKFQPRLESFSQWPRLTWKTLSPTWPTLPASTTSTF